MAQQSLGIEAAVSGPGETGCMPEAQFGRRIEIPRQRRDDARRIGIQIYLRKLSGLGSADPCQHIDQNP
ncbi:hypothetical protein, partial [Paracoccus versutus]|uniref:hypothetical protein n=1 Tax=Paracoccus versutus TaxID=34007 RepID=UPI000E194DF4